MSGGFQPVGFQGPPGFQQSAGNAASITQSIPAFTQTATGTSAAVSVPEAPGGGVFIGPGFMQRPREKVRITQSIPMFTQSLEAEVNDDALVLLLLLV